MTGLFDCGVIIFCATDIKFIASALDSYVCKACKFISSPSKSALYGVVQLKFNRNVLPERILARCAMIDIRCNEGWRLNKTMSPSCKILSTASPTCKFVWPRIVSMSNLVPSFWTIYLIDLSCANTFVLIWL